MCAWFALGIRQARDTDQATAIVSGQDALSAHEAEHARSLLRAAGTLNPDLQMDILRGRLALLQNDRPLSARIFQSVVRREPLNIVGWLGLAEADRDVRVIDLAVRTIARLDPRAALAR